MIKTLIPELTEHLKSLRIPRYSTVVIHSSLFHFGQFDGGVRRFFRMIEEVFDETHTVIMPAFNWEFATVKYWNYHSTKSQCGVLTEYMRKLPDTSRTIHPFHSVSVRGPNQDRFTAQVCSSSFGSGSVFETLYNLSAFNLSLGSPFVGGASFCHYVEELLRVPYRYYKYFDGEVVNQHSVIVDTRFSMYVRQIETAYEFVNTWGVLWEDLLAHDVVHYERYNGFTPILLMGVRDVHDLLAERIAKDPYYVAKKVPLVTDAKVATGS